MCLSCRDLSSRVYSAWPGTGFLAGTAAGFRGLELAGLLGFVGVTDPTDALLRRASAIGFDALGAGDMDLGGEERGPGPLAVR